MVCIVCMTNHVIPGDIYCRRCLSLLTQEDKVAFEKTYTAHVMRLHWAVIELKAQIRASLPRWIRWIVPISSL